MKNGTIFFLLYQKNIFGESLWKNIFDVLSSQKINLQKIVYSGFIKNIKKLNKKASNG